MMTPVPQSILTEAYEATMNELYAKGEPAYRVHPAALLAAVGAAELYLRARWEADRLHGQLETVQSVTESGPADIEELAGRALALGADTVASPSIVVPEWADTVVVQADSLGVQVEIRWDGDPAGDVDAKYASAFADTYQQAYDSAIAQALAEMASGAR